MVDPITATIAKEAAKKAAEKVVEKATEKALEYTSNNVENSMRPQTENPLSKYERATATFMTGQLSDVALATKMEAAAHSACKFFDLPEPKLVQGNSIGVLMDANVFMDTDQFYFNLDQFKDMKCLSFEDMSKIWAHECGHRVLRFEPVSAWAQELGADFFMGIRSEMLGLPSSNIEKALASQPASPSHPYGELRMQAIQAGREYVKDCAFAGEPVSVQGCKEAFRLSRFYKVSVPDFSNAKSEYAAFVDDKAYHYENAKKASENASYYAKEADKAADKGDYAKAKDMQRKSDNYATKAKDEKKAAEMSSPKNKSLVDTADTIVTEQTSLEQSIASSEPVESNRSSISPEARERIKKETQWSDSILDNLRNEEEANIYKEANLKPQQVNGKDCLVRTDIDYNQKDEFDRTNLERMKSGLAPLDKDGCSIELHHVGQKPDSPLAELTCEEHRCGNNDKILHVKTQESLIDRQEFRYEKQNHWRARAEQISNNIE